MDLLWCRIAGRRAKCKSFIKSGGKLLIVMNSSSTCYRIWSQIKFTVIAILVLFFWSCSFSRTILCRSQCDNCKKTIRFWGVRCQDCRSVKKLSATKSTMNSNVQTEQDRLDNLRFFEKIKSLTQTRYVLIKRLKYHKKCSSDLLATDCDLRCHKVEAGKKKTKYNF